MKPAPASRWSAVKLRKLRAKKLREEYEAQAAKTARVIYSRDAAKRA